jgi:GIY-YIG catalytic domain-containing protein
VRSRLPPDRTRSTNLTPSASQAQKAKQFQVLAGLTHQRRLTKSAIVEIWRSHSKSVGNTVPRVIWTSNDAGPLERIRRSIGGWRNTDVSGAPLLSETLSERIRGLATRGPTDPDEATLAELLEVINSGAAPAGRPELGSETTGKTHSFQVPSALFTVGDVVKKPSAAPDEAGIYAWWFDELPNIPLDGALEQDGFRLAYVGIASYRPGSRRTLRQRLRNHCKGPIASSTLRRSLAGVLIDELGLHPRRGPSKKIQLPEEEEARLSHWLSNHGRVAWVINRTPWLDEARLLSDGPPLVLNIQGNAHEFIPKLRALRKRLSSFPCSRQNS